MLREIEIGKQYRLNIRPNPEYRCLGCDRMHGEGTNNRNGRVATILAELIDAEISCPVCHTVLTVQEGVFLTDLNNQNGAPIAVPYTWLEEIDNARTGD